MLSDKFFNKLEDIFVIQDLIGYLIRLWCTIGYIIKHANTEIQNLAIKHHTFFLASLIVYDDGYLSGWAVLIL